MRTNEGTISIDNNHVGTISFLLKRLFNNTMTGVLTINNAPEIVFYIWSHGISNQGTIEIGTASTTHSTKAFFSFDGTLTNTGTITVDNSTMELEVNVKTTAGTDFDQIAVNNAIMLGGPILLTMNLPSPVNNDEVLLINATEIVGTFSSITGLAPGWELKYDHPSVGKVSLRYSSSLSVQLTSFKATPTENQILLSWQTANGENASHFDIERSTDAKLWRTLGRVSGVGNSKTTKDYIYLDTDYTSNTQLYRLKMVDVNGQFKYSTIISVNTIDQPLHVYPNPTNGIITLSGKRELIQVYNLWGQQVGVPMRMILSWIYLTYLLVRI